MARTSDKKEKLLAAANTLIHKQGFHLTSLADIARASGVPLGNVYYYFKTKEDLGRAVVEERRQGQRAQLREWGEHTEPKARLLAFLEMPGQLSEVIAAHGCPVGSLCQELHKEEVAPALAERADAVLRDQLDWVTEQFRAMGQARAEELGVRFIAGLQGASLIANATGDAAVLTNMAQQTREWVEAL